MSQKNETGRGATPAPVSNRVRSAADRSENSQNLLAIQADRLWRRSAARHRRIAIRLQARACAADVI